MVVAWASCASALASCWLWWKSATVKVRYVEKVVDGWTEAAIIETVNGVDYDVSDTLKAQSRLSAQAAAVAAVAAFLQAVTLALPN